MRSITFYYTPLHKMYEDQKCLTVKDVMRILSISRRTVYHWIDRAVLKPIRLEGVLRFDPQDIEALIQEKKLEGEKGVGASSKKRILLVDDDPLVRDSLKRFLLREDYSVEVAPGGEQAISLAERETFDLLICDVRMPGMNGVETISQIQKKRLSKGAPRIPEIVITAFDDPVPREELKRLGVSEYIEKPFDIQQFLGTVRKCLSSN